MYQTIIGRKQSKNPLVKLITGEDVNLKGENLRFPFDHI
jgi:hypothetical protein